MTTPSRLLVGVVLGAGLGALSAALLGIGALATFFVWALAAAAIGWWSGTGARAAVAGAVFGFPLALVFAILTYTGTDRGGQVANDALAGAVGGVACALIASVGALLARLGPRTR